MELNLETTKEDTKKQEVESLVKFLLELRKRDPWCENDEFLAVDYAAGNIDDAYDGGFHDGQSLLARHVLMIVFPKEAFPDGK